MEAQLARAARAFKDVSKSLKEQAQDFINNSTPLEKMLKEATANTNWGCANSMLGEITRAANDYHDYNVIMKHIWEALAAKPKYWRKVYKALTLLEYLVRHGPERIIDEVRDSLYRLRSMSGFHYTDEGRDRAGGVREKAKHIIELVSDTELLRAEREKARQNRDRYIGIGAHGEITGYVGGHFYSGGTGYSDYTGTRNGDRSISSVDPLANRDAERDAEKEQQRIAAEREKARLQRERQKEKTLKKQANQEQRRVSRESSKKSTEFYSPSEDSISESSSSSVNPAPKSRSKKSLKKKLKAKSDSFSTDAGWGPTPTVATGMQSKGFSSSGFIDAFPPPPLPQQSIPRAPLFCSNSANSFSSAPPIQSPSNNHLLQNSFQPHVPQISYPPSITSPMPDFFATSISSPPIVASAAMQSTTVYPCSVPSPYNSSVPTQQSPAVQTLMAQNLASLSAMGGVSQQQSRNPFGSI